MLNNYLKTFFAEKDLASESWEIAARDGTVNLISSDVVIEHIAIASAHEQKQIADVIRKIDFANGDVNDFLKHLAGALVIDL